MQLVHEKAVEATTKRKEEKRKKPKPEEQEGMPHVVKQQFPTRKSSGGHQAKRIKEEKTC
jgi:hypothetical protein